MTNIMQEISRASDLEVEEMMSALLRRYGELFPDWEISILSVAKTRDRNQQIDEVIRFLEKLREMP